MIRRRFGIAGGLLPLRRQSTSVSHHNSIVSLDLDFVLGLLDSSRKKTTNPHSEANSWSRMKFKVIETGEAKESNESKDANSKLNFDDFSSFFTPLTSMATPASSNSNTLDRLQSLADSLPTQIYDRNGNLMPLNSQTPPMSFFEIGNVTKSSMNTNLMDNARTVPIFEREGVDWNKINLTSILKKIVPEEVFLHTEISAEKDLINIESNYKVVPNVESTKISNVKFSMSELKLLDKDQLYSLSKHFNIKVSNQTDHKLEQEILLACGGGVHKRTAKNPVSKEKLSWTEENENLVVKMYEELRIEKQKVDQKVQLLSTNASNCGYTNSLKKCKGSSERGLWAVLTYKLRHASKFHVSVSECRNKLIILKRLKPQH